MIGRIFIFHTAFMSNDGTYPIFTCVGTIFTDDADTKAKLSRMVRISDRHKLYEPSTTDTLYVLKSDTGRIRLLWYHEFERETVDVTEKVESGMFDRFYPGEVMVYRSEDPVDEIGLNAKTCNKFESGKTRVGEIRYRSVDLKFRLHVRIR